MFQCIHIADFDARIYRAACAAVIINNLSNAKHWKEEIVYMYVSVCVWDPTNCLWFTAVSTHAPCTTIFTVSIIQSFSQLLTLISLFCLCAPLWTVESLLQHQSSFPHFFGFWWLKTTVRTNKAPWPQAPVQLLFCLLLNTLCRYFAEHFYLKLWLLCWTGELVIKVTPKTREGREGFNPQFLYPRRIHLLLSFSDACVAQALIILSLWLLILF